eukprot:879492_1
MFTVLLTTIIYGTWTAYSTDLDCNYAFECVGRSLNDTGHTAFNGYKSGFGPTTSWHGGTTICRAAFSCDSMAFLTSISGSEEYIRCEGVSSCANTTITTSQECNCAGANSCVYTQLSSGQSGDFIGCQGDQSCSFAHIDNAKWVSGAGAYSLYKAVIDTQDIDSSTQFTIALSGDYAAYGATLICRSGHTCNIDCYGYTSCFMFYLNCLGNCKITTRFNGTDTIAPITNITQFDPNPSIPLLLDSMSIITTNEHLCNTQTTSLTSDNFEERRGVDITLDTEGPICCRGRNSCRNSVIQYEGITGQDIMCSGHKACRGSDIYAKNGNVFCDARLACGDSIIVNSDIVHCTAVDSCQEAIITKTSTILCSGWYSCWLANITSNGTDLDANFTGYGSAHSVTIYCNVGDVCNIVCRGYESCLDTTLHCDGICDVQCDELSLCPIVITLNPTTATTDPTLQPTDHPSLHPTQNPTLNPTLYPSSNPTEHPSLIPTEVTESPSNPTHEPSSNPTQYPSFIPIQVTEHPISLYPSVQTTHDTLIGSTALIVQGTSSAHDGNLETLTIVSIVFVCLIFITCVIVSILIHRIHKNRRDKEQQQATVINAQEVISKVNSMSNVINQVNKNQSQNNGQAVEQHVNKNEHSHNNESSSFSADIDEGATTSGQTLKIKFPKKRTKGQFL